MGGSVVSHVEFLEIRGRRQQVAAELTRRARDNATLWRINAKPTEPPTPGTPPGAAAAVAVTDPRP